MLLTVFGVRSANGSRKLRVVGIVETAGIRNTFLNPAGRIGTLLKQRGNAPDANTNGKTLPVLPAANGLRMQIGMSRIWISKI